MLRYRTRDLTRLLPGTARPAMRRMEKITGRNDDMIILRGVNLFPTQIEELVLGIPDLSPHFVLELTRVARLDALTVKVERRPELSVETSERAAELLGKQVKDRIGTTVVVTLVEAGTLGPQRGQAEAGLRPAVRWCARSEGAPA